MSDARTPAALGYRMPAEWHPHVATWLAWPHNKSDWPGKFEPIPYVYAEIVRHLLMLPRPEAVYIGVDNEPADRRVVAEWMAKRLGSDLPSPAAVVAARPHGKRCSNRRLRESGYQFLFPSFREGYGLAMPRPAD